MLKFLLNQTTTRYHGDSVWIDPDHITSIATTEGGSLVSLSGGISYSLAAAPDDLASWVSRYKRGDYTFGPSSSTTRTRSR